MKTLSSSDLTNKKAAFGTEGRVCLRFISVSGDELMEEDEDGGGGFRSVGSLTYTHRRCVL